MNILGKVHEGERNLLRKFEAKRSFPFLVLMVSKRGKAIRWMEEKEKGTNGGDCDMAIEC